MSQSETYVTTRTAMVRLAGFIFFFVFLSSVLFDGALFADEHALMPAYIHLDKIAVQPEHQHPLVAAAARRPGSRIRNSKVAVAEDDKDDAWCACSSSFFYDVQQAARRKRRGGGKKNKNNKITEEEENNNQEGRIRALLRDATSWQTWSTLARSGTLPSSFDVFGVVSAAIDMASCFASRRLLTRRRTASAGGLPSWSAFRAAPSIFWWMSRAKIADWHTTLCVSSMVWSACMFVTGAATAWMFFAMWALWTSIISVGQNFYSFGFDMQLGETLFLLMFCVPLVKLHQPRESLGLVPRWAMRWLATRVMLGNGLIKLRSDGCWRDFSCLKHHYETQPNPNSLALVLHALPPAVHKWSCVFALFVEVCAPLLLMVPSSGVSCFAASLVVALMLAINASGNLIYLPLITILPVMVVFHDGWFSNRLFFCRGVEGEKNKQTNENNNVAAAVEENNNNNNNNENNNNANNNILNAFVRFFDRLGRAISAASHIFLVCFTLSHSPAAVDNLLSPHQRMIMSHHSFLPTIFNSVGNFGSITRTRPEVRISAKRSLTAIRQQQREQRNAAVSSPSPSLSLSTDWQDYTFWCKPQQRHIVNHCGHIAPLHARLDWQAWFLGFTSINQPWFYSLLLQMLKNGPQERKLLAKLLLRDSNTSTAALPSGNPFHNASSPAEAPFTLRVQQVDYNFNVKRAESDWDWAPFLNAAGLLCRTYFSSSSSSSSFSSSGASSCATAARFVAMWVFQYDASAAVDAAYIEKAPVWKMSGPVQTLLEVTREQLEQPLAEFLTSPLKDDGK